MGFINYGRNEDSVEVIVRDSTGAKIEGFVCSLKDKKKYAQILNYLKAKYGFSPEIDVKESINVQKEEGIDWWE